MIFFLVLLSQISIAAERPECAPARAVLQRYIELDRQGETLSVSKNVDAIVYYNGRETPGWDSTQVISTAKIQSCEKTDQGLSLSVQYKVFGTISGKFLLSELESVLRASPKENTTKFAMVISSGKWKVDSASLVQPHIGAEAAKKRAK